ncbi:class I SAM-dependent methyltransferase [Streptomyces sp. NPDC014733]|uniref:class I SAM-dependent methyltransferase n=1 Tax=Streptomyces sp. NPDC014733 TaxID=3364885 RepID=UPI00370131BA
MGAIVNTEQQRFWDGDEGVHRAAHRDRWEAVNAGFTEPLLTAAAIRADDRVLDIGCGSGCTTRLAARQAYRGGATGLDLSAPMLEKARESARRDGPANVTFVQGDAQAHPFPPGGLDVAISRFGVMFFADPVGAFAHLRRALRPGGRLAFVCGAADADNEWLQAVLVLRDHLPLGDFGRPGAPGAFSLGGPDEIRGVLTAAGFTGVTTERVAAYGAWGRDADDAADFLLGSGHGRHWTSRADPATVARARTALTDRLRVYEEHGAVRLCNAARLVTATAPS